MAQLDIAERFAPQDGKFQIRFESRTHRLPPLDPAGGRRREGRDADPRHAAAMALKLDRPGLRAAGRSSDIRKADQRALRDDAASPARRARASRPRCTRACSEVATPDVNVITVEDPVEYRMDGINQVPVNPKRGIDLRRRAALDPAPGPRRDPGRRDPRHARRPTSRSRPRSPATWCSRRCTRTTRRSTITRLVDMGIDPFMVSSSLLCIGAQRLARKLCEHCRVPLEVPDEGASFPWASCERSSPGCSSSARTRGLPALQGRATRAASRSSRRCTSTHDAQAHGRRRPIGTRAEDRGRCARAC